MGQTASVVHWFPTYFPHVYAVSFIVPNIPANDRPSQRAGNAETILEVEAWFRRRTDIEDQIREVKLGAALRQLPSGDQRVNTVWMWAALLAGNISTLLQALTRIDEHGRAYAARLRHELLCVPARLVHHERRLTLRLPPGDHSPDQPIAVKTHALLADPGLKASGMGVALRRKMEGHTHTRTQ